MEWNGCTIFGVFGGSDPFIIFYNNLVRVCSSPEKEIKFHSKLQNCSITIQEFNVLSVL